jgi:hypothetical protein
MSRRAGQDANGYLRGYAPAPAQAGPASGVPQRRTSTYLLLDPALLAHKDVPATLQTTARTPGIRPAEYRTTGVGQYGSSVTPSSNTGMCSCSIGRPGATWATLRRPLANPAARGPPHHSRRQASQQPDQKRAQRIVGNDSGQVGGGRAPGSGGT